MEPPGDAGDKHCRLSTDLLLLISTVAAVLAIDGLVACWVLLFSERQAETESKTVTYITEIPCKSSYNVIRPTAYERGRDIGVGN